MTAEALENAGIRLPDWRPGVTYRGVCPQPNCRGKKGQALAVTIDSDGRGAVWHCHRCGWRGNADDGGTREHWQPRTHPTTEPRRTDLSPFGQRLWSECRRITEDDPAGQYLLARSCLLPHPAGDLRWHPSLWHPSGHTGPALVGLVTDIVDALRRMSLHRTWIDPGRPGEKANIDPPRLLLGGHPKAGGVTRLWPDCNVETRLTIGEGAESCLAAAKHHAPVWSAINAGNLGGLPVLKGVDALTIVCDRDRAGIDATQTCLHRWQAAGREVFVLWPDQPGADWADVERRAS